MTVTRRTIIRNLAALSALPLAAEFGKGLAFAMGGSTPPTLPDPTSIFVMFEGPWIIDQFKTGTLRATSFDKTINEGATGTASHLCAVGFSESNGNLVYPAGSTTASTLTLPAPGNWVISPKSALQSQTNTLVELFDAQFNDPNNNVFAYIRKQNMTVNPWANDRTVLFPTPDKVYVGGRLVPGLLSGAQGVAGITDNSSVLATSGSDSPMPYVTVIFEYKGPNPTSLSLSTGSTNISLVSGQHFIFRMRHQHANLPTPSEDAQHIEDAFATLLQRVGGTGNKSLPTLNVANGNYVENSYPDNFTDAEMGLGMAPMSRLHPRSGRKPFYDTYSNCCGGGIVLGGN